MNSNRTSVLFEALIGNIGGLIGATPRISDASSHINMRIPGLDAAVSQ